VVLRKSISEFILHYRQLRVLMVTVAAPLTYVVETWLRTDLEVRKVKQQKYAVVCIRDMTIACNKQNRWVCELCPSPGIVNTRKHNVSETGSVSDFRRGEGNIYSAGSVSQWF
jgi:hypothetical protein